MDSTFQYTDATDAFKQPIATTQRNESISQVAASQSLESTSSKLEYPAKVSKSSLIVPNVLKGPSLIGEVEIHGTTRDDRVSNMEWARQQTPEKELINHAMPSQGRSTSISPLVQDSNLARTHPLQAKTSKSTLEMRDGHGRTYSPQAKTAKITLKLRTKPRKSKKSNGLERELRGILEAGGNSGQYWVESRLRSRGAPSPEAQDAEAKQLKDDMEVDD